MVTGGSPSTLSARCIVSVVTRARRASFSGCHSRRLRAWRICSPVSMCNHVESSSQVTTFPPPKSQQRCGLGLLLLWLADLQDAVDLAKYVASRALLGTPVTGDADQASRASPRIKNALGHAVLPP